MKFTSEAIEKLVEMFSTLPGIGRKTAQRLTFHILRQDENYKDKFINSLEDIKRNVTLCSSCFNYTDNDPCSYCESKKRDNGVICVVEEPSDILVIEKTHEFYGKYHVIHGLINPLEGIGANDLKIKELIERSINAEEIILALNPSVEGEVTTQYIAKLIKPLDVKVSRLASGIPMGSALEYSDEATLSKALEGRIYL